MKRLIILTIVCCFSFTIFAQNAPKWMEKSKKAVVSVTTFDKGDRKIGTTNGFFISENGEALSAYSIFKGAERATVTDADGATYNVASIMGADDLYDVVRFKVTINKKVTFLPLANDPVATGTPVYLLSFSTGKAINFKQGSIAEVSKLKDPYSYYKVTFPIESEQENAPLLLASGQVFGLAQADASGKKENSYAVSASYTQSLQVSATDAFNSVYTNIGIRKGWPADIEQASVSLFLLSSSQEPKKYLETLNDFIATFPHAADGYLSRATHYANNRAALASSPAEEAKYLELALADINTAGQYSKNKGDIYYNQAKTIYSVAISNTTLTDKNWSIGAALSAINQAIETEDLPAYRLLEGEIFFYLQEYSSAYASFMKVNESEHASANSYYMAATTLDRIPGAQISDIIALLDSTITRLSPIESAPYILERINYKNQLGLYEQVVEDYDLYYKLVNGQVNDSFYYYREQAKFKKGDMEAALEDILQAISMNADSPDYLAEEASIYVRMQKYEEALASLQKALDIAPDFGACYRLRGICYLRLKKKAEACEAFNKAEALNDPLAKRLIRENCQ
ncbi:tetratricopeptide (TPR) repeat protein [Parabacteroides sp. PF5-5]|uniref:serine protease n=1 Tax=unclassified Parabacteroides TaxID=2649774 RepID=UPI002474E262|nr:MULTISPECIES: serine protease [unclassified Parabacteroides]MDH6305565.1 tetratricopeptide (TPR) repeat protein [Parabacteroides sp. PH5-39]MDH6316395.1 tetratricopeptide (TPR) repeat protein [Parabacteroides sp. PF5-13]MDH6319880.1 tetratricopeptide (TPR) repeat protein [Parabacteroides sp. PH5-13]MDH6323529.1 tetratricopeptide (TPR) repeat protein [Parabacteroides sp. PH5-8]MDH6327582.1 tetratricopeptide (TPR) repeat protein [Parabacteroides sp. PH5-41]